MRSDSNWMRQWKHGGKLKVGLATIYPDMAEEFLANEVYTRGNKKALIQKYAGHITNQTWHVTGEPIVFNKEGRMVEGHNRCMACVASGKGFQTVVVMGVTDEAVAYINSGTNRNLSQRRAAAEGKVAKANRDSVIIRMMQTDRCSRKSTSYLKHLQSGSVPIEAIDAFEAKYAEGIDFAVNRFTERKKGLTNASTVAAVAKAYYHTRHYPKGRQRLEAFCDVLNSGMPESVADKAVIVLRERLRDKFEAGTGHDQGISLYLRTVFCLEKFLLGQPVEGAHKAKQDIFPLPTPATEFAPKPDEELVKKVAQAMKETKIGVPVES